MKHILLGTGTTKSRLGKRKDTFRFKWFPLINITGKRKRKLIARILKRRAGVKRLKSKQARFGNSLGANSGMINVMDSISELPDCILHTILSFLHSKDAARMSVLSKRWRQVWSSFPQLDIDHRFFRQHEGDWVVKLKTHVDSALQKFASQKINMDRFRLCVIDDQVVRVLTDTWIESAIGRNVEELHMQVRPDQLARFNNEVYSLPPCALSIKTLSVLRLHGCNLETCDNITLPLLRKLSLKKLRVSDKMLKNFLSSCPLIDDLRLVECSELEHVNIALPTKIQKFHLYECKDLSIVNIASPVLQSLWLHQSAGEFLVGPQVTLEGCTSLRDLVMEYPRLLEGDSLHVMEHPDTRGIVVRHYEAPLLEKLVLSKVTCLFDVQVSGEKLIKLALIDLKLVDQIFICAPQLISLEYKGRNIPITLVGPTKLREVNLYFKRTNAAQGCKYHELLRMLGKRGDLKLLTQEKSELIIQENMSTLFPPLAMYCDARTVKVSTSMDYLIDGVLSAHKYPSTISLYSREGSELTKHIYEKLNAGRSGLSCCNYFKNKCWRHCLREVTYELSEVDWSQEFGYLGVPVEPNGDWLKSCYELEWETDKGGRLGKKLGY